MPFTLIKGTFRLVNKTSAGNPTGFEPDGDSMQFLPNNAKLLDELTQLMSPYRLTKIGSVQLRVKPPAPNDGAAGYIMSRSLDVHGRPVAFAFSGTTSKKDGSAIHLTPAGLRQSLNHKLVTAGQAYPLFYDTLFFDLRDELATAARTARQAKRGIWKEDLTQKGTPGSPASQLETKTVVFPKLFRRLAEYLGEGNSGVSDFKQWVEDKKERVFDLDTTNNTHFDTYLYVANGKVSMTKQPERLVFVSAKGRAPWL
jgi:hypothetical protein